MDDDPALFFIILKNIIISMIKLKKEATPADTPSIYNFFTS